MITNYYVDKVLKFLKQQITFDIITTCILEYFLLTFFKRVLFLNSYSFTLNVTHLKVTKFIIPNNYLSYIQSIFKIITAISLFFMINFIYERFLKRIFSKETEIHYYDVKVPKYPFDKHKFQYIIGLRHSENSLEYVSDPQWIVIEEDGLHQGVICIGTIGQGKTISQLTQFTWQMIYYEYDNPQKKVAMLCLDVKGNYYKFVHAFAKEVNRWDDIITIEIDGKWKYNPLHKPNLSEIELSKRMRDILELFSAAGNDPYWIDKAEDTITEILKLIRIYNSGYVNFPELHNMATDDEYRNKKIAELDSLLENDSLSEEQKYNFLSARNYFKNEFDELDHKAVGFIKSEITRITQPFISTKRVRDTFCPSKDDINFYGFEDVINQGKIVVWKINANKEPKIAKLVSAYLKLDFQKEILITLEGTNKQSLERKKIIVCDEYQEYVTASDADFFAQSREPKAVMCASTQSYTSIKKTLKNEVISDLVIQNLVNKIILRTDDEYTVKKLMNHIGKIDKEIISKSLTESSRSSRASYGIGKILGKDKNLSEGMNITKHKDFRFDEVFFTQVLDTYKCLYFISTGKKILKPSVAHLLPLFEGKMVPRDGKLVFSNSSKEIFQVIGSIDLEKLDNDSVKPTRDGDMINSSFALSNDENKELKFIIPEENKNLSFTCEDNNNTMEHSINDIDSELNVDIDVDIDEDINLDNDKELKEINTPNFFDQ